MEKDETYQSDKVLTPTEAALVLKLGKTKVYHLLQRKLIPATKVGNQYLILESELLKWLKSNIDSEIKV